MLREWQSLVRKEFQLEWKRKYALSGLLLYVLATTYVVFLAFKGSISASSWNALFWIIMLFAAVNAGARSFIQEPKGLQLYLYTLASPKAIILSKITYNFVLMLFLALINWLAFTFLLKNLVSEYHLFALLLFLGGFGLSSVLTLISAIASRASENATLMAILSFPVLLPLLLTLIKLSTVAVGLLDLAIAGKYILILISLDILILALSVLLFPYLWKQD